MSLRAYPLFSILFIVLTLIFSPSQAAEKTNSNTESIILAGGCFWCIESDYEKLDGVIDVVSGYSGGDAKNPTYKQVSAGNSGHIEVVKVSYNPQVINRARILDYFWRHIDPTRDDGQFCDRGPQYRPAIFYKNESEKQAILKSAAHIEKTKPFKEPLKVEFIQAGAFYPAEDYHQDYYKKNPVRYKYYRYSCGRDARVEELWGS
ncbi:MAG: peptide-methionine (S)-S-oxide reductase MsrA [Gammaproteobacteria bacterium]|nr:peptide-methionine (S)-S-oxide reductase MsrA [Gammaproteobacteria bacterium]